jgi:GT2 family glycosyltransferase
VKNSDIHLSIIIVSYNTRELLEGCINSIYETTKNLKYEIVIVDNASQDGSPEMIENKFKNIMLIRNYQNVGFAKANNQAIRIAKGKYLLLLNTDTIVEDRAIGNMVEFLEHHPKVAAVGPKVLDFDGIFKTKGYYFPSIYRALIGLFGLNKLLSEKVKQILFPKFYWNKNECKKIDWAQAACLMIRMNAMKEIGDLCEDFFFYYEDLEWCYRAKKKKYEIWYCPSASVRHLGGGSEFPKEKEMLIRNYRLVWEKTGGIPKGILFVFLTLISFYINYLIVLLFKKNNSKLELLKENIRNEILKCRLLLNSRK